MVEVAYLQNAQSLSPTGSGNNRKLRIEIASCSSSSSSMILQQQQHHQQLHEHHQQLHEQHQHENNQNSELASSAPPPFLTKTYDMIDDPSTDGTVSWTTKGTSFVVWNPLEFSRDLLPRYFKHNNFSSFVRQLNTYGFRKVDPDRCEFANEGFRRGQRNLLKNIHRKKPSAQGTQTHGQSTEGLGKAGLDGEVERLNRDKNVLMLELVRLRQQQQTTERELQSMGQRLHSTEQRQQHMISFMAKAIQSPGFLASIVHQHGAEGGGGPYLTSKRRKLELCNEEEEDDRENQIVRYDPQSESTRARLIEFFSKPDLGSKLEVVPLEVLVRELLPADETESSTRAKLTEMQSLPISLEEQLSVAVRELSSQSPIDVPPTPPLDLSLEAKDGDEHQTSSLATSASSDAGLNNGNKNSSGTSLFKQLVGEVNASVDSGAVGVGMNNGFWEQFLDSDSGNPRRNVPSSTTSALPWWVMTGKIQEQQKQQQQPDEQPD